MNMDELVGQSVPVPRARGLGRGGQSLEAKLEAITGVCWAFRQQFLESQMYMWKYACKLLPNKQVCFMGRVHKLDADVRGLLYDLPMMRTMEQVKPANCYFCHRYQYHRNSYH